MSSSSAPVVVPFRDLLLEFSILESLLIEKVDFLRECDKDFPSINISSKTNSLDIIDITDIIDQLIEKTDHLAKKIAQKTESLTLNCFSAEDLSQDDNCNTLSVELLHPFLNFCAPSWHPTVDGLSLTSSNLPWIVKFHPSLKNSSASTLSCPSTISSLSRLPGRILSTHETFPPTPLMERVDWLLRDQLCFDGIPLPKELAWELGERYEDETFVHHEDSLLSLPHSIAVELRSICLLGLSPNVEKIWDMIRDSQFSFNETCSSTSEKVLYPTEVITKWLFPITWGWVESVVQGDSDNDSEEIMDWVRDEKKIEKQSIIEELLQAAARISESGERHEGHFYSSLSSPWHIFDLLFFMSDLMTLSTLMLVGIVLGSVLDSNPSEGDKSGVASSEAMEESWQLTEYLLYEAMSHPIWHWQMNCLRWVEDDVSHLMALKERDIKANDRRESQRFGIRKQMQKRGSKDSHIPWLSFVLSGRDISTAFLYLHVLRTMWITTSMINDNSHSLPHKDIETLPLSNPLCDSFPTLWDLLRFIPSLMIWLPKGFFSRLLGSEEFLSLVGCLTVWREEICSTLQQQIWHIMCDGNKLAPCLDSLRAVIYPLGEITLEKLMEKVEQEEEYNEIKEWRLSIGLSMDDKVYFHNEDTAQNFSLSQNDPFSIRPCRSILRRRSYYYHQQKYSSSSQVVDTMTSHPSLLQPPNEWRNDREGNIKDTMGPLKTYFSLLKQIPPEAFSNRFPVEVLEWLMGSSKETTSAKSKGELHIIPTSDETARRVLVDHRWRCWLNYLVTHPDHLVEHTRSIWYNHQNFAHVRYMSHALLSRIFIINSKKACIHPKIPFSDKERLVRTNIRAIENDETVNKKRAKGTRKGLSVEGFLAQKSDDEKILEGCYDSIEESSNSVSESLRSPSSLKPLSSCATDSENLGSLFPLEHPLFPQMDWADDDDSEASWASLEEGLEEMTIGKIEERENDTIPSYAGFSSAFESEEFSDPPKRMAAWDIFRTNFWFEHLTEEIANEANDGKLSPCQTESSLPSPDIMPPSPPVSFGKDSNLNLPLGSLIRYGLLLYWTINQFQGCETEMMNEENTHDGVIRHHNDLPMHAGSFLRPPPSMLLSGWWTGDISQPPRNSSLVRDDRISLEQDIITAMSSVNALQVWPFPDFHIFSSSSLSTYQIKTKSYLPSFPLPPFSFLHAYVLMHHTRFWPWQAYQRRTHATWGLWWWTEKNLVINKGNPVDSACIFQSLTHIRKVVSSKWGHRWESFFGSLRQESPAWWYKAFCARQLHWSLDDYDDVQCVIHKALTPEPCVMLPHYWTYISFFTDDFFHLKDKLNTEGREKLEEEGEFEPLLWWWLEFLKALQMDTIKVDRKVMPIILCIKHGKKVSRVENDNTTAPSILSKEFITDGHIYVVPSTAESLYSSPYVRQHVYYGWRVYPNNMDSWVNGLVRNCESWKPLQVMEDSEDSSTMSHKPLYHESLLENTAGFNKREDADTTMAYDFMHEQNVISAEFSTFFFEESLNGQENEPSLYMMGLSGGKAGDWKNYVVHLLPALFTLLGNVYYRDAFQENYYDEIVYDQDHYPSGIYGNFYRWHIGSCMAKEVVLSQVYMKDLAQMSYESFHLWKNNATSRKYWNSRINFSFENCWRWFCEPIMSTNLSVSWLLDPVLCSVFFPCNSPIEIKLSTEPAKRFTTNVSDHCAASSEKDFLFPLFLASKSQGSSNSSSHEDTKKTAFSAGFSVINSSFYKLASEVMKAESESILSNSCSHPDSIFLSIRSEYLKSGTLEKLPLTLGFRWLLGFGILIRKRASLRYNSSMILSCGHLVDFESYESFYNKRFDLFVCPKCLYTCLECGTMLCWYY